MTRIVRLHAFGGPEHLRAEDMASPQPGPGEVRLRAQAARVTRDHYSFMNGRQFKGHGFEQPSLPRAATACWRKGGADVPPGRGRRRYQVGMSYFPLTAPSLNLRLRGPGGTHLKAGAQRSLDAAGGAATVARNRTGFRFIPQGSVAGSYSLHVSRGNYATLGASYVRGPAITPRVADTLTFTASWGLYF